MKMDWFDRLTLGFVTIGISELLVGWLHSLLLWLGIILVSYSVGIFLAALALTVKKEWAKQKTKKMMSADEWLAKWSDDEHKQRRGK